MSTLTVTQWASGKRIKGFQIIETALTARSGCNECLKDIKRYTKHAIIHIDVSSDNLIGEWREYRVCFGCLPTVTEALSRAVV